MSASSGLDNNVVDVWPRCSLLAVAHPALLFRVGNHICCMATINAVLALFRDRVDAGSLGCHPVQVTAGAKEDIDDLACRQPELIRGRDR